MTTSAAEKLLNRSVPLENRPKRQPVFKKRVLSAPTRTGYIRRWVNDVDDRVKLFEEGGWSVVEKTDGTDTADKSAMAESSLGSVVSRHTGSGKKSILMEIREDWYNEDQQKKAEQIKANEQGILNTRTDGQYGKIEVTR